MRERRSYRRGIIGLFGILAVIVGLIVVTVVAVAMSGLGTGRLQTLAQSTLTSLAGEDVAVEFSDARLTWHGPGLIGLELREAHFETAGAGRHQVSAESVQFGIRLSPLISGDVELSGINVNGLNLVVGRHADNQASFLSVFNERGLVEPDRVSAQIFSIVETLIAAPAQTGETISVQDLVITGSDSAASHWLVAESVNIQRQGDRWSMSANGQIADTALVLEASAGLSGPDGSMDFELSAKAPSFRWEYVPGSLKKPFVRSVDAELELRLSGVRINEQNLGSITAEILANEIVLETVKDERQVSQVNLMARLDEGAGKIEIEHLIADIGNTRLDFHGAVQPAPANVSQKPVYRYELVSDGSKVAASDSPERAVGILARIAGILDPEAGRLSADELRVRTTGGEVIGNAALVFPSGKTPAAFLAIEVPKMPVSHAKQLWPWKAADGARSWVLRNVFGGEVRDSNLQMSVVAGRFGDGKPFTAEEVSGHFEVFGTRFDTAGEIPPVRDANGTVDFRGTDVTIRLSSGTAFLPSGRTVDASNGIFEIAAAKRPLVGALEIDVAGEADAVAELSTFEPIDASRYIDLKPEDFSGQVSGLVSGNIPLQRVPDPDVLTWRVALDYKNLSISQPFDGQILTEAEGSIVVDPQSAVIDAKGKLNGIPAEIALTEPLGKNDAKRQQDLKLVLDGKARAKIAPALNTILAGTVVVDVAEAESGGQLITTDLTRSTLSFPWAGWSKGSGIPAKATFKVSEEGANLRLSDIDLAGESFSLKGDALIKDGAIQTARFGGVRLNRGDQFDLSIDRNGRGYRLAVSGKRIDARSLIRQFLADPDEAGQGLDDTPVTLDAKADQVLGFGGESVTGVRIDYNGTGTKASGLQILATTASGKSFAVNQSDGESGRRLEMRSADAGAILRFLNIYDNVQGGSIEIRLSADGDGPLRGQIDARDFWIVNEPRLEALVATAPEGDGRSLNQAVRRDIDVSKAKFEQGFAQLEKGSGYLSLVDGVLRGPLIGSTFQGQLYDPKGQMSVTGTFMPAYGLNRLFADIPVVGLILGNGRDRGLIGITYKLSGDAKSPRLQINPISVIAPGIFRSIFEFR